MFVLYADKNRLTVLQKESVTSGSVNVYPAQFKFSPDWDGLTAAAVFQTGGEPVSVLLDESGRCMIPPEALSRPMRHLMAGGWGVREGRVVLPTVWADLGVVLPGAAPGPDVTPPTPELWRQELAGKGDRLQYTLDGGLGLYAGERLLASVPVRVDGADGIPALRVGRGLRIEDGLVCVNTAESLEGDMTLPITAAAVEAVVGNVKVLLETI